MHPSTAFRFISLLPLLVGLSAQAQQHADTTAIERELVLPTIDEAIRLAIAHSPEQRMFRAETERNRHVVDIQKRQWTQYFFVDLMASTGNSALLIQQATGDVAAFQNYNSGYRATLNMRLPVQAIAGRKPLVRAAQYEVEAAIARAKQAEQLLADLLIPRYYAVQTALALLRIKADGRQSTQVSRALAEREFRQGQINAAELTHTIESAVRAAIEYEETKQRLFENLRLLENLVGTKLY